MAPPAQLVERHRDELLADAALAFEEDGDVRRGDLADAFDDPAEGGGVAEEAEAFLEGLSIHAGMRNGLGR